MNLLTAVELADAIRSRKITAVDATTAALNLLELHDAKLGAFQVVRAEQALAEARALDARADISALALAGVPIVIKDNIPVAGEPVRG